jgi:hypothetical protein
MPGEIYNFFINLKEEMKKEREEQFIDSSEESIKFCQENPLQTMSDQDLYSMLCDLPDDYYNRLESLMNIAKDTRKAKEEWLKKKK